MISDHKQIYDAIWDCLYNHYGRDYDKTCDRIRTIDFAKIECKRKYSL